MFCSLSLQPTAPQVQEMASSTQRRTARKKVGRQFHCRTITSNLVCNSSQTCVCHLARLSATSVSTYNDQARFLRPFLTLDILAVTRRNAGWVKKAITLEHFHDIKVTRVAMQFLLCNLVNCDARQDWALAS